MVHEQTPLLPQNNLQSLGQRAQIQRYVRKTLCIAGLIILPFLVIIFFRSRRASVPDVINHDFGVGFDLTYPYG
jgi:hypothetical protein